VERRTITLKRPDPATKPKVDPLKAALSEQLGMRFIDRGGRYIFQRLMVAYSSDGVAEVSRTWRDVPLVPEAYIG
jgi:hypothetical protein